MVFGRAALAHELTPFPDGNCCLLLQYLTIGVYWNPWSKSWKPSPCHDIVSHLFAFCKDRPCSVNGNTLSSPNLSLTQANCQSTSVTCKCFYVVSWLVARFAIVPKKTNYSGLRQFFGRFHCCGKKILGDHFFEQNVWVKKTLHFFSGKNLACLPSQKKNQIAY